MSAPVWEKLISEIEAFTSEIRDLPIQQLINPNDLRAEITARFPLDQPVPLERVTEEVGELLRKWTVHVTHPRYFGLFNPSVRQAGIVADALAALYNPQLAAYTHAQAVNELERLTLRHFMDALGFDHATSIANFTSGGMEANLTAFMVAMAHHFPEWDEAGIAALTVKPVVYVTGETHHSLVKIVRMAGLGTQSLRKIPVNDGFAMDTDALAQQIEADRAAGWYPLMIVGTAGTTSAGTIDPLPAIADVAEACGAWYHVDGAWGASAVLSPKLRPALTGIERADSVTWDAHKWLSVPMGAGMFFCKHPAAVRQAFAVSTSYMPAEVSEDAYDPYITSVQWTRRAIGMKVFMSLAEVGLDGYGAIVQGQADVGDALRARLHEAGWIIVNNTPLPVICFTHPAIRAGRISTREILDAIYERNKVWISDVMLGGKERVLRACITSFRSTDEDLDVLMEELALVLDPGSVSS